MFPPSRGIISQTAHKTHKEWSATERSADLLLDLLVPPGRDILTSPLCRRLLHRVLEDGGWQLAERYAEIRLVKLNQLQSLSAASSSASSVARLATLRNRKQPPSSSRTDIATGEAQLEEVQATTTPPHSSSSSSRFNRPWVVVICGLNGIRKSTSVYQPWFQELLHSALLSSATDSPRASNPTGPEQYSGAMEDLPHGSNSFFRQLDYMIATIACEDFRELYEKAGLIKVAEYSSIKDAIFARYRTLAEMIGIILLKEARLKGMNVMLETSGKDVASFRYIDHLFPNSNAAGSWEHRDYNKLIVHFTIDDIRFAEQSVDTRMQQEMRGGAAALEGVTHLDEAVIRNIISVNSGGPYGSAVLQSVQEASDETMNKIFSGHTTNTPNTNNTNNTSANEEGLDYDEFDDWYMARIQIRASESGWSACSQTASGKELKSFSFENR